MTVAITALGTAVPGFKSSQEQVVELMSGQFNLGPVEKRRLRMAYMSAGIHTRHSVLEDFVRLTGPFSFFPNDPDAPFPSTEDRMDIYKAEARPLAAKAILNCFAGREIQNEGITHIITVSCTGMYAPGLDIDIIRDFSLSTNIHRTTINFMGCYGAFAGLKMAHAICKAESSAKVLLVSVELCSIHFQKSNSVDNLIASAVFADGASAVLVESHPSTAKYIAIDQFYCDIIPQSTQEMAWEIGNQGFNIVLSSYVPKLIESGMDSFAEKLFAQSPLSIENMDYFAIHAGSKKILESAERALKMDPRLNQHSHAILQEYGNMSSATILFILKSIWETVTEKEDKANIFSCAFGPGLTVESMLLKIHA